MDDRISNGQPVFDEATLLQRIMDDRDLEKDIVRVFLHQIPDQIRHLKRHIQDGDVINARLQAHMIRGAAANLSAGALRESAFQAEERSKKGDLTGCMTYVLALESEFDRFVEVIEALKLLQPHQENVTQ